MEKQKIKIKDIKRDNLRQNLKMVHPFLSREFRSIKKTDLNSRKVYKEFFGDEEFKAFKLRAIYEYQL
jgi:hypothetical protein